MIWVLTILVLIHNQPTYLRYYFPTLADCQLGEVLYTPFISPNYVPLSLGCSSSWRY